jgi:hypothetical protein
VAAHDRDSGLACRPEYGPSYGDDPESESSLTARLLARRPERSLLLGDGHFGIFLVAYQAQQAGHDVRFRLTEQRFRALLRQAKPVGEGRGEVTGEPSAQQRRQYGGPCRRGPGCAATGPSRASGRRAPTAGAKVPPGADPAPARLPRTPTPPPGLGAPGSRPREHT